MDFLNNLKHIQKTIIRSGLFVKVSYLFLFLLFLIKLPPLYLFGIENKLFATHTFAKLAIYILTILLFFVFSTSLFKRLPKETAIIFRLVIFFFVTQSLSIITASDLLLFLKSYHNLIACMGIFFITYIFGKNAILKLQTVYYFILFSGIFFIILEGISMLFNNLLVPYLELILQKEVMAAYIVNIERGRYTLELDLELFLPFFIYFFTFNTKSNVSKIFSLFIITLSIFFSIISNFRSRLLALLFGLMASLIFIKEKYSNKIFRKLIIHILFMGCVLTGIYLALLISRTLFHFNIIDRILLENEYLDYQTVIFRVDSIRKSFELLLSSPLFGIGLGNYSVYIELNWYSGLLSNYQRMYSDLVDLSPHNNFAQIAAETGAFGLFSYSIMIFYFFIIDFKKLNNKSKYEKLKPFIISFWSIFILTFFNPGYSIFKMGWFWFLRGTITTFYYSKSR